MARDRVTVLRGPVEPGSEAQIDYGRLGMWLDPATAKRVAVWAFVMVLSCSGLWYQLRGVLGETQVAGRAVQTERDREE